MRTDTGKAKIAPSQILDEMARLTTGQLETVIRKAAILRLQKQRRVMPVRESDLLQAISHGLSPDKNLRLEQLEQKLRDETITQSERRELLRLTNELERLAARRLKALIDLAALRKTSVNKLMHEMGLTEAAYA